MKARYAVSTSIDDRTNKRLQAVRSKGGYTVPEILKMGIEEAEREIEASH